MNMNELTPDHQIEILSFRVKELGDELRKTQLELIEAKANLRTVSAGAEDVWFWEEGGSNNLESLTCPVVMSAATLRRYLSAPAEILEVEDNLGVTDERLELMWGAFIHAHGEALGGEPLVDVSLQSFVAGFRAAEDMR